MKSAKDERWPNESYCQADSRLESTLTQGDREAYPRSWEIANVIYERPKRRVEAEGRPFTDPPPAPMPSGPFRMLSIAETLRLGRKATRRRRRMAANSYR